MSTIRRNAVTEERADAVRTPENGLTLRQIILLFTAYLAIAALFHAAGLNLFRVLVGAGDGFTAGLPSKIFATHLSPWNPYVQLGQYSFANTQFQPFYPPALLIMMLLPDTFGYNMFILTHYAFAGLFFCLFARNRHWCAGASFVGGLLFMLGGFLSAHKGHQAMMSAAIWLPLMLFFIDRYLRSGHLRELAGAAVALAFSMLAGFPQVTVYFVGVAAIYTLYRFHVSGGRGWRWMARAAGALAGVVALAVLLSSLQLFAVAEGLPEMTREKLTYASFSENYLPVYHILAFVVPNFYGGFFQIPTYSSEFNVVEVYPYMGLLPLALAYAALRYYRGNKNGEARLWGLVALAGFVLAIGQTTPLNRLMFHVPVYNLFRAPARHLFEVDFAIAVLATIGLDLIFRSSELSNARLRRSLMRASNTLAVAFVGVYGIAVALRWAAEATRTLGLKGLDDIPLSPVIRWGAARDALIRNLDPSFPTLLLPAVFFALSFLCLRLAAGRKALRALLPAIAVIMVADLYLAYSRFYSAPDTTALGHPAALPVTAALAAQRFDPDIYRIFTLDQDLADTYPLLNMTYRWSAVNDYTPMWLKRYVTMTDFGLNGAMPIPNLLHPNVMAAAGARYVIARNPAYIAALNSAAVYDVTNLTPIANNPAMMLDHAAAGGGAYLLHAAGGPSDVSLIQTPVTLDKSTRYQISFTARAPEGLTNPLVINLYAGPTYDSSAQYAVLYQLPASTSRESVVIDSGPAAPKQAFARIYTQSTTPVEIGDIHLAVVHSLGPATSAVYRPIFKAPDGTDIFLNQMAQPRFRFVQRLRPCHDSVEARAVLDGDASFNVATDALVEGLPAPMTVPAGEILSRHVGNNELEFRLKTGDRGFFVVADSWFPGWSATVDGRGTAIAVVDGFMRGVLLSGSGVHDVKMTFHPWSVPAGGATTLFGLLIVAAAFARGDRFRRFTSPAAPQTPVRPESGAPENPASSQTN